MIPVSADNSFAFKSLITYRNSKSYKFKFINEEESITIHIRIEQLTSDQIKKDFKKTVKEVKGSSSGFKNAECDKWGNYIYKKKDMSAYFMKDEYLIKIRLSGDTDWDPEYLNCIDFESVFRNEEQTT